MEKDRSSKKEMFLKTARATLLAASLSFPFGAGVGNIHADPQDNTIDGIFTGYYCERRIGYPGYDSGGNCGTPYYGGEAITGMTAGCGSDWDPGDTLLLENWPLPIVCNDNGKFIASNHIDVFFQSDEDLHNARSSGQFLTHGKVTKIN